MEKTENYRLTSDWGKLKLAGEDIYSFNNSEEPYNKTGENGRELNINTLEEKFGATLIEVEVDKDTGFAAYAFTDNKTGEVVISYVGTEAGKDNNSDVVVDAEIGGHNLTNANKLVFNDWEHELELKQYDQGEAFYEKVKQYADGKTIRITGHSLGGGIANTVALRYQEDDIDVLALNPAPVLNRDVDKFGNGFDMKNVRNIINQNDPLHIGIKAADFTLPGRMYKIPNQAGHSYAFTAKDYDESGHLIWLDKLASDNDTGWDIIPGILELSQVAASYVQDLLDLFKGDFVVDTNVAAIVSEHILSHRHSLLNLFMNDNSRGINRSLLGEIAKDVKELSKDLKQLNDDVSEAVFSMFAKDEELGAVSYY